MIISHVDMVQLSMYTYVYMDQKHTYKNNNKKPLSPVDLVA